MSTARLPAGFGRLTGPPRRSPSSPTPALGQGALWVLVNGRAAAIWTEQGTQLADDTLLHRYRELLARHAGVQRCQQAFAGMAACGAHQPAGPHEVLHSIAVAAHARNRGHGSALLREMLRRYDGRGSAAYLESSSPRNLTYYRRHGFAVVAAVAVAGGDWLMATAPVAHPPPVRAYRVSIHLWPEPVSSGRSRHARWVSVRMAALSR